MVTPTPMPVAPTPTPPVRKCHTHSRVCVLTNENHRLKVSMEELERKLREAEEQFTTASYERKVIRVRAYYVCDEFVRLERVSAWRATQMEVLTKELAQWKKQALALASSKEEKARVTTAVSTAVSTAVAAATAAREASRRHETAAQPPLLSEQSASSEPLDLVMGSVDYGRLSAQLRMHLLAAEMRAYVSQPVLVPVPVPEPVSAQGEVDTQRRLQVESQGVAAVRDVAHVHRVISYPVHGVINGRIEDQHHGRDQGQTKIKHKHNCKATTESKPQATIEFESESKDKNKDKHIENVKTNTDHLQTD